MGMRSQRFQSFGRWALISALIVLATGTIFFSVSLPPASGQSGAADVELLTKQIDFILKMNSAFLGFLGIIGALLTWFFKNNLEDAKEVARTMVRQELSDQLEPLIKTEVEHLQRTLQTEQIISNAVVDYYLPSSESRQPIEYILLKNRGFLDVRAWNQSKLPPGRFGSVLVIDFVNSKILDIPGLLDEENEVRKSAYKQREKIVNETVQKVIELKIGTPPILVLYVKPGSGRIEAIDQLTTTFPEIQFYSSANTPVSLMGAVVDSAYVAYGDRAATRSSVS
ncbi:MAG: hypothetical protein WBA43_06730 [Elainellaceae cyanobacterium]